MALRYHMLLLLLLKRPIIQTLTKRRSSRLASILVALVKLRRLTRANKVVASATRRLAVRARAKVVAVGWRRVQLPVASKSGHSRRRHVRTTKRLQVGIDLQIRTEAMLPAHLSPLHLVHAFQVVTALGTCHLWLANGRTKASHGFLGPGLVVRVFVHVDGNVRVVVVLLLAVVVIVGSGG